MSVAWHSRPNRNAATHAAAGFLMERLVETVGARGQATLAISGGTLPRGLFNHLAADPLPWDRIHLFWVDERCVPPDHADSNFRMARESLLASAAIPTANIHRVQGELAPAEAAARYADDLRGFFDLGAGELPVFDVIHLGLGPDCHMASLFPGEALIQDRAGLTAAVYVEKMKSWRVTLLPGVLLAARHVLFFTAGAEKAAAVQALRSATFDPLQFPAQVVMKEHPAVAFFLDGPAGSHGT